MREGGERKRKKKTENAPHTGDLFLVEKIATREKEDPPEMETTSRWRPHPPCASARIPMSVTLPDVAVWWNSFLR